PQTGRTALEPAAADGPAGAKGETRVAVRKSCRRPQKRAAGTNVTAPAPEIQNNETRPADLTIAANQNAPARPQLEINTGSAPLAAKRKQTGDPGAAPEMAPSSASNGAASTLIALSATPGPSAPVEPP